MVTGTDSLGELVEEIELLVQAGCTATEAIHCATGLAGELLGLPAGTIALGQYADLIFTEGDPLADPGNLRNVRTVVKGGDLAWTSSDGFAFDRQPAT